jgi:hypothetical protein
VTAVRPSSPDSQPTALDLRGSQGITLVSVSPHFRHSKVRRSKPSGPADTSTVIIRVLHLRQRGRPIGKSSGSGLCAVPMVAPLGSVSDAEILGELLKIVCPVPDKWLELISVSKGHRSSVAIKPVDVSEARRRRPRNELHKSRLNPGSVAWSL